MILKVKDWADFQHYKHRSPPWIKLHRTILDNYDFHRLPDASRALAPCLWLLASEHQDGEIDADIPKLAYRLRKSDEWVENALKPLIEAGFFIVASGALADCKQDAMPEKSRDRGRVETETETEQRQKGGAEYAFAGRVIRLTRTDFQSWKDAYSHLDLPAELQSRDAWLADNPDAQRRWFASTAAWLANRNAKRKAEAPAGLKAKPSHADRQRARLDRTVAEITAGRRPVPLEPAIIREAFRLGHVTAAQLEAVYCGELIPAQE